MRELKGKIREIYDFIVKTIEDGGVPPSVREICRGVNLQSTSSVHSYLNKLQDLGYIRKDQRKMRTISLPMFATASRVPIIGRVTAGSPILAVEEITGYVCYETKPGAQYFALRVKGDSMINAGIFDGDVVIVKKQDYADSGQVVVALLDDEATVKRLRFENGTIWLVPENPAYTPINGNNCKILGRVCALTRNL